MPAIPPLRTASCVTPAKPVPRLPRPVLLLAGGTGRRTSLPMVAEYMTAGRQNKFGGEVPGILDGSGTVFSIRFSERWGPLPQNAREIRHAVEAVRQATGADEIDVVAECKAALEMREYVQQGHDGVRNLVMIAPPNHGITVAADVGGLAMRIIQKLHLPIDHVAEYDTDPHGVEVVRSFATDWRLGPWRGNRRLSGYNTVANMHHEAQVLHSITVIGGAGHNQLAGTLGNGIPSRILRGDHTVPQYSAFLPNAQNFFYDGPQAIHTDLKRHPDALAKVVEALTTDGHPAHDAHYVAAQLTMRDVQTRALKVAASLVALPVLYSLSG